MDNKHNDRRIFDLAMHTWLRYALVFLKWLLWAAVIGMALGLISTAFHYSVELFGGGALPFFALACAASYLLSGYSSLYGSQRIVLDKWHIGE